MTKPWWQSQIVIIAALILFFPLGLGLMWLYAPWRLGFKWGWTGFFGIMTVLAIIGSVTGSGNSEKTEVDVVAEATSTQKADETKALPSETAVETVPDTPTVAPSDTPPPPPTPEWKQGRPLSVENIREVLADSDKMIRSLDLGDAKNIAIDGGTVTVTYKGEDALSETDLLTIGAQTSFSVQRALFANPLVQTVTVIALADWTDQYGKTSEEVTTMSSLNRTTVDTRIDWAGLEDRVMSDNKLLFCISDAMEIHPAIYVRLKDKGCLTGSVR